MANNFTSGVFEKGGITLAGERDPVTGKRQESFVQTPGVAGAEMKNGGLLVFGERGADGKRKEQFSVHNP